MMKALGFGRTVGLLLGVWTFVALSCSQNPGKSGGVGENGGVRSNLAELPVGPYGRIVSLTPNLTEMLAAVGAVGALVGRTPFCTYPPEVESVPIVSGGVEPDVERLLAITPDLVVVQKGVEVRLPIDAFRRAGIEVYVSRVETAGDVARTLRELGQLTGHVEAGETEARRIEEGLARVVRENGEGRRDEGRRGPVPRVLMIHGHRPLIAAGPGSWGDELIRQAGYANALTEGAQPYPSLDAEWVVRLHPDVVVDTSFAEEEGKPEDFWRFLGKGEGTEGEGREGRTGTEGDWRPKLVFWSEEEVLRPGPRLVRAVELLRERVEGTR